MPVVQIKIDNKEFNLECGDEEDLLRKLRNNNLKLQEHRELLTLPEAQKFDDGTYNCW